jgi:hypothetical protein
MSEYMERRERVVTIISTTGKTLNEIIETAMKNLDGFFSPGKYEILEIRAEPTVQNFGGEIFLWKADIVAGEVWG